MNTVAIVKLNFIINITQKLIQVTTEVTYAHLHQTVKRHLRYA